MKVALTEIDRRYWRDRVSRTPTSWIASSFEEGIPRLQVSSAEVSLEDRRRDPPATEAAPVPQAMPMTDFKQFAEH